MGKQASLIRWRVQGGDEHLKVIGEGTFGKKVGTFCSDGEVMSCWIRAHSENGGMSSYALLERVLLST